MKDMAARATKGKQGITDGMLIPLEDDCMFAAVMRNRDACTGFLEALFGVRGNRG